METALLLTASVLFTAWITHVVGERMHRRRAAVRREEAPQFSVCRRCGARN